jgi:membrane protein implicated in regulation of membrane protease activity
MENTSFPTRDTTDTSKTELTKRELNQQRRTVIMITIGVILVLAILITALVFLLHPNTDAEYVARIRDVFIIIMALETLLVGVVLVVLIIQMARLTNLLQNEIKPILESTNETISTLRGTSQFLSDNLVEPVLKINEYSAGIQKLVELIGLTRKKT